MYIKYIIRLKNLIILHKPGEKFEFSFLIHEIIVLPIKLSWLNYVGAIRTLNNKYQKFMTYLLVNNIKRIKINMGNKT